MTIPGAGGQVPPRPDQQVISQPPVPVSPGSTNIVRAQIVIVSGPSGKVTGVFVYTPGTIPANGNPPIISITESSQDLFGNAVNGGVVVGTASNTQIQLQSSGGIGQLAFLLNNALFGNAVIESAVGSGFAQVVLNGPKLLSQTDFVGDVWNSASSGAFANREFVYNDDTGTPHQFASLDGSGFNIAVGRINGPTPGTGTGPANVATAETVHQATLINSWAGSGGGVNGLFYWVNANNELRIIADIQNATATGNSTCFTLPAGWRPANSQNHPAAWNNPQASNSATPPWVFVSSGGAIQITGIEVANKGIFFSLTVPMVSL